MNIVQIIYSNKIILKILVVNYVSKHEETGFMLRKKKGKKEQVKNSILKVVAVLIYFVSSNAREAKFETRVFQYFSKILIFNRFRLIYTYDFDYNTSNLITIQGNALFINYTDHYTVFIVQFTNSNFFFCAERRQTTDKPQ